MNNLLPFYTTCLGIEVAIFSIITAVIFIFIQLIYLNYSYKHIKFIFLSPLSISFFITSFTVFIFTILGFLILTLNPNKQSVFTNMYALISILSVIFGSVSLFFLIVFRNFKFLQPSRVLLLSSKNIRYKDLRLFLFKKYGIKSPEELGYYELVKNYKHEGKEENKNTINFENIDINKVLSSIKDSKDKDENYKSFIKRYNALKVSADSAINSIEPIYDIAIKSIVKLDIKTVTETKEIINNIIREFIKNVPVADAKEIWNPDDRLLVYFTDFIIENIETQLEICDAQKINTIKLHIIEISECLYNELIKNKKLIGLPNLFSFWKKFADESINSNPRLFKKILFFYKDCCEKLFVNYNENVRYIENIFRDIGWIGERLLTKKDFEIKPLMMDLDYYNEYDELMEFLLSFDNKYKGYPSTYPLIYFAAIDVVFLKLTGILSKNRSNYDIKDNLFSLPYIYYSFGLEAMEVGNSRGAGLAVARLFKSIEILEEKNLESDAEDIVKLFINLGAYASDYKDSLERVDFLGETIDEFVINKISQKNNFISVISDELREIIIKSYDFKNEELIRDFINKLGKKMHTDFNS